MAEKLVTGYQRLLEIHLLHHYWLDDGATVFDLIADADKKVRRLLDYDRRAFITIKPTATTAKTLKGFQCVYRDTALGCVVAVPKVITLPMDTALEFLVTVQSAAFYNYTALTLQPTQIYNLYHAVERKLYRYKENIPVLSNLTGAARGSAADKALFVSKEIPALTADDKVESLVNANNVLLQLTSDQPAATTRELNASVNQLPVFVHQGDVPTLVSPPGLLGVPGRGVQLSDEIDDDVFAIIRVSATRSNDGDFSFLDASGHAKATAPIFQIRFKNRSTTWKYFDKRTLALKSAEPKPMPMTYFGNAGTKQKASSDAVKVVKNGSKIDQLTSDIFI